MNIYKCIKVIIGLFLLNIIKADEIEYFWSGAVTPESAVISFATDKKAKIKIQYSETKNFKKNHGSPIHIGDPYQIGIDSLETPDFGEFWKPVDENDIPVFWACGVTPQVALKNSKIPIVYTHSPGNMFVTDLKDNEYN